MKSKIFSYVLRYDDGAAPNPFWGICTLTICKPAIRRTAKIGDWVIGTGSKNSKCEDGINHDFSNHLVYAMKISKILTMSDYDIYCKQYIPEKIPDWKNRDWKKRIGDCIYDFSNGKDPNIRKSVHNEANRIKDLSGINSLLSDTFYYFGEKAIVIPQNLKKIIKRNQGHLKIENEELYIKRDKLVHFHS